MSTPAIGESETGHEAEYGSEPDVTLGVEPGCIDSLLKSVSMQDQRVRRYEFDRCDNRAVESNDSIVSFCQGKARIEFTRQASSLIGDPADLVSVVRSKHEYLDDSASFWFNRLDLVDLSLYSITIGADSSYVLIGRHIDSPGLMSSMNIHVILRSDLSFARAFYSMLDTAVFLGDIDADRRLDYVEFVFSSRFFTDRRAVPGWMEYRVVEDSNGVWHNVAGAICY